MSCPDNQVHVIQYTRRIASGQASIEVDGQTDACVQLLHAMLWRACEDSRCPRAIDSGVAGQSGLDYIRRSARAWFQSASRELGSWYWVRALLGMSEYERRVIENYAFLRGNNADIYMTHGVDNQPIAVSGPGSGQCPVGVV